MAGVTALSRGASFRRKQFGAKKSTMFTEIEEDDGTPRGAQAGVVDVTDLKTPGGETTNSLDRHLLGNQNSASATKSYTKTQFASSGLFRIN